MTALGTLRSQLSNLLWYLSSDDASIAGAIVRVQEIQAQVEGEEDAPAINRHKTVPFDRTETSSAGPTDALGPPPRDGNRAKRGTQLFTAVADGGDVDSPLPMPAKRLSASSENNPGISLQSSPQRSSIPEKLELIPIVEDYDPDMQVSPRSKKAPPPLTVGSGMFSTDSRSSMRQSVSIRSERKALLVDSCQSFTSGHPNHEVTTWLNQHFTHASQTAQTPKGRDTDLALVSFGANISLASTVYCRSNTRTTKVLVTADVRDARLAAMGTPYFDTNNPDFDVFEVNDILNEDTQPSDLEHKVQDFRQVTVVVAMNVFLQYTFVDSLGIDMAKLRNYMARLAEHYHDTNPYHNNLHASDVLQSTNVFLMQPGVKENFSDFELFCVLFSAVVHDVGHIGVSNDFLHNSKHPLSVLFSVSPLESMHVVIALQLLQEDECSFLSAEFHEQHYTAFVRTVQQIVLGTDMKNHAQTISMVNELLSGDGVHDDEVPLLLKAIVHAADISNPAKPYRVYKKWIHCVMNEFWRQGDEEGELNLTKSLLCDRNTTSVVDSQVGFITYVVKPFFEEFSAALPAIWLERLDQNAAEIAKESFTVDEIAPPGSWKDVHVSDNRHFLIRLQSLFTQERVVDPAKASKQRRSFASLGNLQSLCDALGASPRPTKEAFADQVVAFLQGYCPASMQALLDASPNKRAESSAARSVASIELLSSMNAEELSCFQAEERHYDENVLFHIAWRLTTIFFAPPSPEVGALRRKLSTATDCTPTPQKSGHPPQMNESSMSPIEGTTGSLFSPYVISTRKGRKKGGGASGLVHELPSEAYTRTHTRATSSLQ